MLEHLPERRPPRHAELTIGYRVPGPIMDLAAKVLPLAAPGLAPPSSIRHAGDEPVVVGVDDAVLDLQLAETVREELKNIGAGNIAVITPDAMADRADAALTAAGVEYGRATRQGLDRQVTVVPVSLAKGLELDSVIVVEPGRILTDAARGAQSLYVALTRSTKRLTLLHSDPLPDVLR